MNTCNKRVYLKKVPKVMTYVGGGGTQVGSQLGSKGGVQALQLFCL